MAALDQRLDLGRMRDLRGRGSHSWVRRALLTVLCIPVLLALTGSTGQPTRTLAAAGSAGRLRVEVPDVLRGGLLWHARIAVRAIDTIEHPRIILGPGFVSGMQFNTIEPSPESEAGRGPHVVLSYPTLAAGDQLVVYLQLQVNPTTVGDQDTAVEVDDATARVARLDHTITVLP